MLQSKLFYKTVRNPIASAESISHDLLLRGGFVDQLMAGVYTFLPLGFKVLRKIEEVIRREMAEADGQELLMPVLQPKDNWAKTGRLESMAEIIFRLKGNGDKEYVLGSTHEEVLTPLAKKMVFSYRDLPLSIFQIQTKFRDELRPKSGILRVKEFIMKDLYSFHATQEDLDRYYQVMAKHYEAIFRRCGIGRITHRTLASGGTFSKYSDEFQALTPAGEDIIYVCAKCGLAINKEIKAENPACPACKGSEFEEHKALEVGNIFKLGTRFSSAFELKFTDRDGQDKPVLMGSYGIGLGRLMGAIVEASHDENGIIWPASVAPFSVHLIAVENSKKTSASAGKIYKSLHDADIEILYDERQNKSAGEKFAEADLIGIPYRLVVSEKTLKQQSVELKERGKKSVKLVKIKDLVNMLSR